MATPKFTAEYGLYKSSAHYQSLGSAAGHMQGSGRASRISQASLAVNEGGYCVCKARDPKTHRCIDVICGPRPGTDSCWPPAQDGRTPVRCFPPNECCVVSCQGECAPGVSCYSECAPPGFCDSPDNQWRLCKH